jgi:hypothetical protein
MLPVFFFFLKFSSKTKQYTIFFNSSGRYRIYNHIAMRSSQSLCQQTIAKDKLFVINGWKEVVVQKRKEKKIRRNHITPTNAKEVKVFPLPLPLPSLVNCV